jgi:hypothetical protein
VHQESLSSRCQLPVFAYNLFCEHSIDYFVEALSSEKKRAFDQITEAELVRPAAEWKAYLKDLM